MKNNWKTIAAILIISVAAAYSLFHHSQKTNKPEMKERESKIISNQELSSIKSTKMFFDMDSFNRSKRTAISLDVKNNIRAIIIPHHLLAVNISASLLKEASGREINQVIIIGPNHENAGNEKVLTTKAKWQTKIGDVYPAQEIIENLKIDLAIKEDSDAFRNEHSVGAIAPLIKELYPEAKIVPIIFSSNANMSEVEKISSWLTKNVNENSLVVFSIDFSHYLTQGEAEQKDKVTEKLIKKQEIEKIMKLNNDYVDSPPSLATAVLFAKKMKYDTKIIHHANANDYSDQKSAITTSYFGITISNK